MLLYVLKISKTGSEVEDKPKTRSLQEFLLYFQACLEIKFRKKVYVDLIPGNL